MLLSERRHKMSEDNAIILQKLDEMDLKIRDLQLTLENETNRNIKLIAEGHMDLNRKLDEALKIDNEKEILIMRVNTLENELRRLKERIDRIA